MNNSNDCKELVGTIIISLLLIFLIFSCSSNIVSHDFDESLHGHTYICVNGEEYKIEDIEASDVKWGYDQSNTITLYMKDGTVIYTQSGAYTVK
jgi:hypothetical protein